MSKYLILTEKNSVARKMEKALGGMDGVFDGIPYRIVAARGHLLTLKEPHELVATDKKDRYQSWTVANLPWNVSDFHWEKTYKKFIDARTKKPATTQALVQSIQQASRDCDTLVIATDLDPSGEGELLAWEIIDAIHWRGQVKRMEFVDESVLSFQKGFRQLKDLSTDKQQDSDYVKAEGRERWDYLSMQLTRAATDYSRQAKAINRQVVVRMGRLKSVMVKLTYDQLQKIKHYVRKPYYEVRFKDENGNVFKRKVDKDDPTAFFHEAKADAEKEQATYGTGTVVKDKEVAKHTAPPALMDLAKLSSILAKQGYAIKEVLATYQKMYEREVVSYPRTEDRTITVEQFKKLLPLVDRIADVVGADKSLLTYRRPRTTHVKDTGAHGANRPGPNVPKKLSDLQVYGPSAVAIYELLARNFLAMFGEDYQYTAVYAHLEEYPTFTSIVNVPSGNPNYRDIFDLKQYEDKKDDEEPENMATLGTKATTYIHEGANPKPPYPTAAWLTKQLEKANLGTGATRSQTLSDITEGQAALLKLTKDRLSMTDVGNISAHLLQDSWIGDMKMTFELQELIRSLSTFSVSIDEIYRHVTQLVVHDMDIFKKNSASLLQALQLKPVEDTFTPKEKVTRNYQGTPRTISAVFGGHRFTDEELTKLFNGEDVTIALTRKDGSTYELKGRLAEYTFNKKLQFGFQPYPKEASSMANAKIPKEYCGHYFTEAEVTRLRKGERVDLLDAISKQGKPLQLQVFLGEKEYQGRKFIGLKAVFLNENTVPDKWSEHVFTEEEKAKLLRGERVTVTTSKFTVDVTFEEAEWNGQTKKRIVPHFAEQKEDVPNKWGTYEFTEEEKERLRNGETLVITAISKQTNLPYDAKISYGMTEWKGRKRMGIILHRREKQA